MSLWLYHPAFRHCLSNPGSSLSTHRKKYLLWVEGKAINFPLSIDLGLWAQEVIPRGLAGTGYMRCTTGNSATTLLENTVHHSGYRHSLARSTQWALAFWWQAVQSRVGALGWKCTHACTHVYQGLLVLVFINLLCDPISHAVSFGGSNVHIC